MLKDISSSYRYHSKRGKAILAEPRGSNSLRLAVLSDHVVPRLQSILASCLEEKSLSAEVYESDFGTYQIEVLDKSSALYEFNPDIIYLNLCSQAFRERFYSLSLSEKESFAESYFEEITGIYTPLADQGKSIILNTFPQIEERIFGEDSPCVLNSLSSNLNRLNQLVISKVKSNPNLYLLDVGFISSRLGLLNWYHEKSWYQAKIPFHPFNAVCLAKALSDILAAIRGKLLKCIVLDLDNTMWGGIIGDDGVDGIKVGPGGEGEVFSHFQNYIKTIHEKGVLLAVCSKNEEENAKIPFNSHPHMIIKEEDIVCFIANWTDKASNIRQISLSLNLGLDSFVFLDDNPVERAQVKDALPQVVVPELPEDNSEWVSFLDRLNLFNSFGFTDDDLKRSQMYKEEAVRVQAKTKYQNINEFLISLDINMEINPFRENDVARIAQLLQRSNQFNLRTQRLTEGDCRMVINNPGSYLGLSVKLEDKFGDYGLVSVVNCRRESQNLFIDEFAMSCRVLKRGVEEAIFEYLINYCRENEIQFMRGEYLKTPKNNLVKELYGTLGFIKLEETESSSLWELSVMDTQVPTHFINVRRPND